MVCLIRGLKEDKILQSERSPSELAGPGVDFINPFNSTPSSYALRRTFTPKKASQKLGAEREMALRPTFSLYEIDPGVNPIKTFWH